MQLTSELAEVWIKYCLIVISHAKNQAALDHLADIIHTDIRMLFSTGQLDEDERAWAVQHVNDALTHRKEQLLAALQVPPNHEH